MQEEPKYLSVASVLRREIATHRYQDGDALMTELELSRRFSVSRQTVRQAISLLEQDGLVIRRRGSGTYVTHRPRKRYGPVNVGVITTYITDYIFPSIVRGIESVLSAEDCVMNLSATYNRVDHEKLLLERFLQSPMDGLIVEGTRTAQPNPNIELYQRLLERNIPVVFINGYYPELGDCPHVVMDDVAGGEMAVRTLLDAGHRHIAGLFKSDDMQGHRRYQGFLNALMAQGTPPTEDDLGWFSTENKTTFFEQEEGKNFLQRLEDTDALVSYNDEMTLRLLDALAERGFAVPDQLSIVSFDNSSYAAVCRPRLTTLCHAKDEFGRQAGQLLLDRLRGESSKSVTLPWQLEMRDSVQIIGGKTNA